MLNNRLSGERALIYIAFANFCAVKFPPYLILRYQCAITERGVGKWYAQSALLSQWEPAPVTTASIYGDQALLPSPSSQDKLETGVPLGEWNLIRKLVSKVQKILFYLCPHSSFLFLPPFLPISGTTSLLTHYYVPGTTVCPFLVTMSWICFGTPKSLSSVLVHPPSDSWPLVSGGPA